MATGLSSTIKLIVSGTELQDCVLVVSVTIAIISFATPVCPTLPNKKVLGKGLVIATPLASVNGVVPSASKYVTAIPVCPPSIVVSKVLVLKGNKSSLSSSHSRYNGTALAIGIGST